MGTLKQVLMEPAVAAWVQAVGSIFAIAVSVYVVNRAHRLNTEAEKLRAAEKFEQQMDSLLALVKHAFNDLNALCDDPDDEHALARHWRDKSNNSVQLQLAQIQYDLDQLAMLPPLDTPALHCVHLLVYSLIVVKSALEREAGTKTIEDAGRKRVSAAAWETKECWGKSLLTANVIINGIRERRESRDASPTS